MSPFHPSPNTQTPLPHSDYEALESTVTLVNPTLHRTFVFNRSSVINATIYSCARPVYKIKSNDTLSRTDLFDLNEQKTVASIKRRQFLPDVVAFAHRNNKHIRVSKWLKRRKDPFGQNSYVNLATSSGTFVWRRETAGSHRFALYFDSEDDSPVAYSKSIFDPPTIGLILTADLDNHLVEIITSFLVLENKYRMDEKADREMVHSALRGFIMTVG